MKLIIMMIKGWGGGNKSITGKKTYLLELEAVLEAGSRFGHEAGGVDAAVPQAAAVGEMSLEFFPVSSGKGDRLEYYNN